MASKNIVSYLNKGEKLNGDNYNIWHHKIQYNLEEQEVLETLTQEMTAPKDGNIAKHRRDRQAYQSWLKKDHCVHFTMLSSMHDDLISEFEEHATAHALWDALKLKFGGTSTTRLRNLNIKFESYKMHPNHTMK